MIQSVDHVALLPAYLAAGTAVLVFLLDLILAPGAAYRRSVVLGAGVAGAAAAAAAAVLVVAGGARGTFCTRAATLPGDVVVERSCSYVADGAGAVVAVVFCLLTIGVLLLSVPALRGAAGAGERPVPSGEYVFLLLCSLTGGVVLGFSRDLITLLVALETLTLPLYVLVGLRRGVVASVSGAVTFFVVSVVSTTVTLLGAALLYALTGAVHLDRLAEALAGRDALREIPLTGAAVVLVLVGLAFKLAAVPFHGWAPGTYDGAPLPVAAYLSTASKLGGVVALLYVGVAALRPWLDVVGPVFAMLAVVTMTVGNLVALRQQRIVRLLAWSSVAQAGYILAPLGGLAAAYRDDSAVATVVTAAVGYAVFYVLIELAAFGSLIGLRGAADGGPITAYQGVARRSPWWTAGFALALAGLAGLPPGLAGLFAKIVVVRALLEANTGWLAVVVALNAVIGLAYYVRLAAVLYRPAEPAVTVPAAGEPSIVEPAGVEGRPSPSRAATSVDHAASGAAVTAIDQPVLAQAGSQAGSQARSVVWPVAVAVAVATAAAVVVGFAPGLVLDAAALVATF